MKYQNYSVGASGLYQKSKVEMEGYVLDAIQGNFKKYVDGITGVVSSIKMRESVWDGKTLRFFEISLLEDDTTHTLSVSQMNQKGTNYSTETRLLLGSLKGYEVGERVTLMTYYKAREGSQYKDFKCFLNYTDKPKNADGRLQSTGYIMHTDAPAPIVTELLGIKQYNFTEQVEFYKNLFDTVADKIDKTVMKSKVMLPAANGIPYEDYVTSGWSDAQMIDAGFLAIEAPKPVVPAPSLAPPPPSAPVAPTAGKTPPVLKTPPSAPIVVASDEEDLPF